MAAPVITAVSPTPNTTPGSVGGMSSAFNTAAATPVVLTVTDADGASDLLLVVVSVSFIDGTPDEVAYRAGDFAAAYVAGSAQVSITNGLQITVGRGDGWPSTFTVNVDVVDRSGNAASASLIYLMPPRTAAIIATAPVSDGALDLFEITRNLIVGQLRA